jgi:hypothetical protein
MTSFDVLDDDPELDEADGESSATVVSRRQVRAVKIRIRE